MSERITAYESAQAFYNAMIQDRDARIQRLESERDALAVENAALIEGLRCIYTTALIAQDAGPEILYSWDFANQPAEEIEMWISDAKETDSALAAIEARGVEKFADFLDSPIDGIHCFQYEVGLAQHFASRLREGKLC